MTHTVQNISPINLTWFSTPLILTHIQIFHCAFHVSNQVTLIHLFSLKNVFFTSRIHLKPGSPCDYSSFKLLKQWLFLKILFFFFYTPCTWLKIFLFASHCHFQTMSPHFLEVGVRSVGISPIPLRLRLPDLNTTPSLSSGDLCHSSPCLGRQLLAVNLCIFINSCHNNRQLQPSTWLFNISWYYVVIVSCSKCDQVVWIFFFLRILVFYRGFLIYLQI